MVNKKSIAMTAIIQEFKGNRLFVANYERPKGILDLEIDMKKGDNSHPE